MFIEQEWNGLKYVRTNPKNFSEEKKYPVLIFLHGAGTRGNDLEKVKTNSFYLNAEKHILNCITVSPLCHTDTWFDIFTLLLDFCAFVSEDENVDKNAVYLMGASMGGYAVWQTAMSKPELFAGIIPICGGGMYWNVLRLKNIPVWAFHGENDDCVFVEESKKMVNAVNANGGNAKLTVYPNTGHDAWTATYQSEEVFAWLFAQRKNGDNALRTNFNDGKLYG